SGGPESSEPLFLGSPPCGRCVHTNRRPPAWSSLATDGKSSDAHRHQDVKRVRLVILAEQRRGGGIGQMDFDRVAVDLSKDIEEVARVEADLETIVAIIRRE